MPDDKPVAPGPLQVLASIVRAWFGVQSEAARARDFASRDPRPFIVAGLLFTAALVAGVVIAVNLVLSATP